MGTRKEGRKERKVQAFITISFIFFKIYYYISMCAKAEQPFLIFVFFFF